MRFHVGLHLFLGLAGIPAFLLDEVVFDEDVERIASGEILLDRLVDGRVLALAQQAPEGIFVVVGDLGEQGRGEDEAGGVAVVGVRDKGLAAAILKVTEESVC